MKRTALLATSLLLIIAVTSTARLNAQVLYGSITFVRHARWQSQERFLVPKCTITNTDTGSTRSGTTKRPARRPSRAFHSAPSRCASRSRASANPERRTSA